MSTTQFHEEEIPSCFARAKEVEDRIVRAAEAYGYAEESVFALRLSLEEALTNAIRHGNAQDVNKKVAIRYQVNREQVEVFVADEGRGFDPVSVPDPTTPEHLEIPSGRGIMLMRAYMNVVEYNRVGNVVRLVKRNESR
jgi:serine/threonine-protein kinase RsbW